SVAFESDETSATILRGRTSVTIPAPAPGVSPPALIGSLLGGNRPSSMSEAPAPGQTPEVVASANVPAAPAAGRTAKSARGRPSVGASPPASSDALWRAFQEGVGLELSLPTGPSPEFFSAIGEMLKMAVGGIHWLIAMRIVAKSEMHADLTMIQIKGNNPLKFAPDPAVALKMLLQPALQGFLSGPEALRDALIDVQSHQAGVMAGMRAALEAILEQFDPARLESQLSSRSIIDAVVPVHRRARLWELYLEHNRDIREKAQEDFGRFFNEAFRKAYEAQVHKLEAALEANEGHPSPLSSIKPSR
ncbi:MAG TPA: type VI secretion system-associated FHA domain protein TagH, partial [Burkholderiaceae bacterium]|nr:type VI secretion system-associated FHA domain protein TagH [Burkholderiaceae bacterium]